MTAITYKISGERFRKPFKAKLVIAGVAIKRALSTLGTWSIDEGSGLDALAPLLSPGGTWEYHNSKDIRSASSGKPGPDRGFLFLMAAGKPGGLFIIALHDVPGDYLHGPFCSNTAGKGELSVSLDEDIPLEWVVWGPGCV